MRSLHLGSDHAGVGLKQFLARELATLGYQITDHGTDTTESCDYALIAQPLCKAVLAQGSEGVLICGTGLGMSMAANRFKGIRAAKCNVEIEARLAKRHNNANILCLGARIIGMEQALAIALAFLDSSFEGGRHQRRIDQLERDHTAS